MTDRIGVTRNTPNTSFWLEADLVSQNVAGNYSTIACYLRAANGPAGSTGSYSNAYGIQHGQVDGIGEFGSHSGNPFLPSGYAQNQQRWRDGPWYVNIGHNSDGTHGGVTLRMILNYSNTGGADVHYTGSIGPFPTIPRASSPTWAVAGNAIAGVAKTLNTNRADAGFTHDITYTFGSASGTVGTGVGASVSWTPPLTLLNQIPNATVGTGTFTTVTKSGATVIGTSNVNFNVEAAADIVPDFTTVTHFEATSGVAANVGAYVQSISALSLFLTGSAGVYGSTISSYKIEVSGQTINAITGTTTPISQSGTVNIVGTVTDSRGRIKQKTIPITVMPYAPPVLTDISVQRALSSGVVDIDEGTYLKVNINASVTSLINTTQRNAINYRVSTRPKGTSTWTVQSTSTPGGITYNSYVLIGPSFTLTTSYDVLVEVYDDFSTSVTTKTVPVASIFMHWDGEDGVGFGKFRENGRVDVSGDIYTRVDPITGELGTINVAGHVFGSGTIRSYYGPNRMTSVVRDSTYGVPSTDAARVTLANRQVLIFNIDFGWWEMYFADNSLSGMTVDGLVTGIPSGWYPVGNGPEMAMEPSATITATAGTYIGGWAGVLKARGDLTNFFTFSTSDIGMKLAGYYDLSWWTIQQSGSGQADYHTRLLNAAGTVVDWMSNIQGTVLSSLLSRTGGDWRNVLIRPGQRFVVLCSTGTLTVHNVTGGTTYPSARGQISVRYRRPPLVSDV